MRRVATDYLKTWLKAPQRKPLILRGARQIGKTTLVRMFCELMGIDLIELNLEKEQLSSLERQDFDIQALLDEIQLKKRTIIHENSLLFFDEIQDSPRLLKFLRYFYEERPHLKVIAAGSLLEIALKAEDFSFPVGRVEFYHLGPMNFQEFLWATGQEFLDQKLSQLDFSLEVHKAAIKAMRDFYYVGGMPEVVSNFAKSKSLVKMRELQNQIIQAYEADFPKYNRRTNTQRIARIFTMMASFLGEKVIYQKLDDESSSRDIRKVVELLVDSRIILSCHHSNGTSSPLEGESDARVFKSYLLDIGLLNAMLRLDFDLLDLEFKNNFNSKGIIAEQFVAQHLSFFHSPAETPKLYYHLRDKGVQKAEIDFLIEFRSFIYPLEVKSAAKGHLKSLKYFCENKKSKLAFKLSLNQFQVDEDFAGDCKLISLPLYAVPYLRENFEKLLKF